MTLGAQATQCYHGEIVDYDDGYVSPVEPVERRPPNEVKELPNPVLPCRRVFDHIRTLSEGARTVS